jgi:glycosyltransferase involved in cell wall biosynthesis
MIVKNEESRLAHCLDSARGLDAELIVVDTGSTDNTIRIAANYGAAVVGFDFSVADFAAARNRALDMATGLWILVLDADEILFPESVPLIRELILSKQNAGYYFERLNFQPGVESPPADYVVRLFPNHPRYRYHGRVHETIDDSILAAGGRLLRSGVRISHDFAPDPEARRRRNLRYIGILNEELAADPSDHSRLTFLAAEYHQLGMFDQAADIAARIAVIKPLDAVAQLHTGVYQLIYKGDREAARAALMRALSIRPQYPEALSFLQLLEEQDTHLQPR